jgi:hypothetical protein
MIIIQTQYLSNRCTVFNVFTTLTILLHLIPSGFDPVGSSSGNESKLGID